MYAVGPWSKVIALDARTGRKLWSYDPQVPGAYARRGCCDVVSRGLAYDQGRIYLGAFDGRLIALDARSGRKLWSVQTTDPNQNYTITGAPRVVKGRVIIGNGGAEYAVRGYVSAYDGATGKLAWRFYTVPGDPAKGFATKAEALAAPTWAGEWWKLGGGGTVWDSMAYDPDLDLLYFGVGNGGPWDRSVRSQGKGDNLFVSSIVAVRPETGEYVWHFQEVPGDEWDYTATQHMILADLTIKGQRRKVIMQAPKNGYFYARSPDGRISFGHALCHGNWSKGLDPKTGRPDIVPAARYSENGAPWLGLPSPAGGHSWQPMSYDAGRGLVYLPTAEMPYGYVSLKPGAFQYDPRGWNTGQDPKASAMPEDPAVRAQIRGMIKGALVAWDPVAGKRRWSVPMPMPWNGGVLATAGGLVFQGNATGEFAAYASDDGKKLWSADLGTGIVAPPITYRLGGVQYVSVAVGWGHPAAQHGRGAGRGKGAARQPHRHLPAGWQGALSPAAAGARRAARAARQRRRSRAGGGGAHAVPHPLLDVPWRYGGEPQRRAQPALFAGDHPCGYVRRLRAAGRGRAAGHAQFRQGDHPAQAEAIRAYVVKRAGSEGGARFALMGQQRA
jgi:alcohol dehydrogenase (cytochrome c)/quinohemoprotein ethanol dehydrogenase